MSFAKQAHVTSRIGVLGNTHVDVSEVSFRAIDLNKSSEKGTAFDTAYSSIMIMKWFVWWSILKTDLTGLSRIEIHVYLFSNKPYCNKVR